MTTAVVIDYANSIKWTSSKNLTINGKKLHLQKTLPTEKFWNIYKVYKQELKDIGISVNKYNGIWEITKWTELEQPIQQPSMPQVIDYTLKYADKLLPYQHQHTKNLVVALKNQNAAIDCSDTGTGKTYTALAVMQELEYSGVLVICPKNIIHSWDKVMDYFNIGAGFAVNYEAIKLNKTPFLTITNIDGDKRNKSIKWTLPKNVLVIFDEAHKVKSYKSMNSKILIALKEQAQNPILLLSATLASNPVEMYAVGTVTNMFSGTSDYFKWLGRNQCYKNFYGWTWDNKNSQSMNHIHNQIFPKYGSRMKISELGDLFPETLIITDTYDMKESDKIRVLYEQMQKELAELRQAKAEDKAHILTKILRQRQEIELLKIPTLVEMIQDAVDEGNSVAVFANFSQSMTALSEKLNTKCLIWGNQTDRERQQNIENFQADKERIIICNIKAGGVGISLHDLNGNYPRVSMILPTYSAIELKQALGRVHRAGGKTKSIQKIIYAADTIEDDIAAAVKTKLLNIDVLNNGSILAELNTVFEGS